MIVGTLLSGCGKKEDASSSDTATKKVTIDFWTISLKPTFNDLFDGYIKTYQDSHKNATIKWSDIPYDSVQNKLITSIAGGTSPDVVNLNTTLAMTLAGKDALVDLNKEATDAQKSIYIKTLWESTKYKDGMYAFPWYGAPSVLVYNKDILAKAGITEVPKNLDEMLSIAKQVKDKTGAYVAVPDEFVKTMFLDGIKLVSDDKTKAVFNTPETVALLTKLKKAADDGIIPKTNWGKWEEMLQQYSTGKIAMINAGSQTIKRIKDEAPDIYKVTSVTTPILGKAGNVLNPVMNLVVPKASKNHKEAIDFANFITNDDNQLAFCKKVQIFPSTIKAAKDPFFKADSSTLETKALTIVADELDKSADLSIGSAKEQDVFTAINKAEESVVLGTTDVKTALDNAEKEVNKLLSQK
jgi:putative chitobiose transport system substrate-binding protein